MATDDASASTCLAVIINRLTRRSITVETWARISPVHAEFLASDAVAGVMGIDLYINYAEAVETAAHGQEVQTPA